MRAEFVFALPSAGFVCDLVEVIVRFFLLLRMAVACAGMPEVVCGSEGGVSLVGRVEYV